MKNAILSPDNWSKDTKAIKKQKEIQDIVFFRRSSNKI
jgi:hypothetical protein